MLNRILRSSISQVLFTLVSISISFFLTPFLIRGTGDHSYGLWVLINTVTSYLGLSDAGMAAALQNHLAIALGKGNQREYQHIFSSGLVVYLVLSLLLVGFLALTILVLWITGYISVRYQVLLWGGLLCGGNVIVSFLVSPYASVLVSQLHMDSTAWIAIVQSVATALLMVLCVKLGAGVPGLAVATLIGGLLAAAVTWKVAHQLVPGLRFEHSAVSGERVRSILRYSGKKLLAQMADILRFRVDELVTGLCISVSQVTHYSVALRLATLPNDLQGRVMSILNPVFARYIGRDDPDALRRRYWLSLKVSMVLATCAFAGLVLLGKSFIRLWVGPHYQDAYVPLVLLSGALWLGLCQTPSVNLFYATNTHQRFAYLSLGEGVANLMLSLLFVIHFKLGIAGVALGTLVPMVVTKLLIQPSLALRLVGIPTSRFYLLMAKTVLPIAVSCLLIGAAARPWQGHVLVEITVVSGLLCLACVGNVLAVLTPSERKRVYAETLKRSPASLRAMLVFNMM